MTQRIRQFMEAGRAPSDSDWEIARTRLDENLFALFARQHPRDVVHAATTARWLLARGYDNPDLIAAALLHDIAKGQQRRLDRVAWVATGWVRLAPILADPRSRLELRRAMARTRDHSRVGAEMLAAAGAAPRVVGLTARHHGPTGEDPLLDLLQQADAAS